MSKFSTLDAYTPQLGKYELLPFRFESLDGEEVVVTNFVGEFVILKKEKLTDVVQKKLLPTEETYSQLRSRHFIQEASDTDHRLPIERKAEA